MFFNMINDFLANVIDAANEFINSMVADLLLSVFWPETTMGTGLGFAAVGANINFDPLFALFVQVGFSLITLKFLKKGFDIYIGWYDGDRDNEAGHLLINYVRAIVTVLAFGEIYQFLVNVISALLLETLNALTDGANPFEVGFSVSVTDIIASMTVNMFVMNIMMLIILIILVVIIVRLLILGLQLLMLRIAFPVACVGLVDSDKGIFKNFFQKFIMLSVSAFAMIFFFRFATLLLLNGNPFWALAAALAALKTPDTLRDFMVGYGTGGLGRGAGAVQTAFMINRNINRTSHVARGASIVSGRIR